jgi:hypothetical protein
LDPFSKSELALEIEATLTEDGTNESTIFDEWSYLLEDSVFGVGWRADDDDISIRHYF